MSFFYRSTVRAIGDTETLNIHENLLRNSKSLAKTTEAMLMKSDTVNNLENKRHRNSEKIEILERMDKLQELIDIHEKKKKYMIVLKMRMMCKRLSKEVDGLTEQKMKVQSSLKDLNESLEYYTQKKNELKAKMKDKRSRIGNIAKHQAFCNVKDLDKTINDINRDINSCSGSQATFNKRIIEEEIKLKVSLLVISITTSRGYLLYHVLLSRCT